MWQGQAVGRPHTWGREAHPWANQMTLTQGQLGNPRDTGDSLPDPQGPQPGHTQLAWIARDRGTQLPRT